MKWINWVWALWLLTSSSLLFGGEPVPGAEVYIEQEPREEPIILTTTGKNGTFSFKNLNLREGTYRLVCKVKPEGRATGSRGGFAVGGLSPSIISTEEPLPPIPSALGQTREECYRYDCTAVLKRFRIERAGQKDIGGTLLFRPVSAAKEKNPRKSLPLSPAAPQ